MFDAFEGVQNLCDDLRITEDKKAVLKLQRLNTGFFCLPFKMEKKKCSLQRFNLLLFKKQTSKVTCDFWGHSCVLEQSLPALKIQHIVHITGNCSQV